MKRSSPKTAPDYSDLFLLTILVGIVLVVLGLMMAVARSNARLPSQPVTATSPVKVAPAAHRPPFKIQH